MFIQQSGKKNYRCYPITLLVSSLIFLSVIRCKCDTPKTSEDLIMEVTPTALVGEERIIEAIFRPADGIKVTDLNRYKLRINLTETGDKGSSLKYLDGSQATLTFIDSLEKDLTHFSSTAEVDSQKHPLKISFTILPANAVTSLDIKFELLNGENQVLKTHTATWKKHTAASSVDLRLTSNTDHLVGQHPLSLTITNHGNASSDAGKLSLLINQDSNQQAVIAGAELKGSHYELILSETIPANTTGITKDLTIIPGTDKQAKFIFQLQYEDGTATKLVGNPVTVTWERGVLLVMKDIIYDRKTHNIQYTLSNEGTVSIAGLKLYYGTDVQGVKIDSELLTNTQAIDLGELAAGTEVVNQQLGKLDFGGNKSIPIDFWLSYTGGPAVYAKQSVPFLADDIVLSIDTLVQVDGSKLLYSIQNTGKDLAQSIQLRYTNISSDQASQAVTLGSQEKDTINIGSITPGTGTGDQRLPINFKSAVQARFNFELLYENTVIATQAIEVKRELPKLKLIPVTLTNLVGKETEVVLKIKQKVTLQVIELDKLSLEISQIEANAATMLYKGTTVTKLSGVELGQIGDAMKFVIEPHTASSAKFNFKLLYEAFVVDEQAVTWQKELNDATKELFKAVENDDIDTIKKLLDDPAMQVDTSNEHGNALLYRAIIKGDDEIIKLILEKGANANTIINAGSHMGIDDHWTVLHEMVDKGNKKIAELLINKEADINTVDFTHGTPLHVAIALSVVNEDMIKFLIAKDVDVNIPRPIDGATALHIAARQGKNDYVQLLLAKGADINAQDSLKNTPLHQAVVKSNKAMVQLLLDKGAKIDIPNKEGETAVDLAKTPKSKRKGFNFKQKEDKGMIKLLEESAKKNQGKI